MPDDKPQELSEDMLTHIAMYARAEVDLAMAEGKPQFESAKKRVNQEWKAIEDALRAVLAKKDKPL